MPVLLQIALGGALGAGLRHLLGTQVARLLGFGFPWGTLAVNTLGCFAMGLAAMLVVRRPELGLQHAAPFVTTGLLGGFTTFSAFSLETFLLVERGRPALAIGYVVASLGATFGAFALAVLLTRPAPAA
jgi:fluoride exporter